MQTKTKHIKLNLVPPVWGGVVGVKKLRRGKEIAITIVVTPYLIVDAITCEDFK